MFSLWSSKIMDKIKAVTLGEIDLNAAQAPEQVEPEQDAQHDEMAIEWFDDFNPGVCEVAV
jgi:hypothetical protein